jgi:hypothetical protein
MQLSIFLQIYKVYNAKGDRDYVHMFILSFFQFVSCAGVSVEFYLLPFLLVYIVIAMWALTVFHFWRQLRRPEAVVASPAITRAGHPRSGRLFTPGFFLGGALASFLVAVVGALLFIFFPRSAASDDPLYFPGFLGRLGRRLSSGISDSITLDIAGIINRNPTPVMRASLPNHQGPPPTILWRCGALHHYDGHRNRWNRPAQRYESPDSRPAETRELPVNILVRKAPGLFIAASDYDRYGSVEDLRNDPGLLEQEFTLLYGYNRAPIFSAYSPPVAVVANVHAVGCDEDESFRCQQRTRYYFTYSVFSPTLHRASRSRGPGGSLRATHELNEAVIGLYTQLPEERNSRFNELARRITEEASTDYQKARAIRNYLALHCHYSLELTQTPSRKGLLYDFLFRKKRAHCEYFASAMVILLRELGIPSRLAYGYSAGHWDAERRVFEVRQLDAHAWAEAFLPGRGWIPFDPTPPVPEDETPQTFLSIVLSPFTRLFRYCEERWAEGVIGYTRRKQGEAFRFVASPLRTISRHVKETAFSLKLAISRLFEGTASHVFLRLLLFLAAASVPVAVIRGILRLRRRARVRLLYRRCLPPRRSGRRVKFYEKMLRLLVDKGITKKVSDTPLEFAEKTASANRLLSDVRILTDLYYFVRFGSGTLSSEQSRTVQSALRHLSRPIPLEGRTG